MPREDQGGELAAALRAAVDGEVDFGAGRRAEYSGDASLYRCVPLGVVFPRDAADVEAALATCRQARVPLTFRGGGTSISGQAVGRGVVVDCSRHLDRIVEVDPERRVARAQPGWSSTTCAAPPPSTAWTWGRTRPPTAAACSAA
jgi:FAD/FMN-containing dehydrogenase